MGKPTLDMAKFNFDGETLMAVSEMVYEDLMETPELASLYTIFPGIVAKKELGYIGEGGLVGKANQGCNPKPHDWNIETRRLVFDPIDWEVLIHQCWKDIDSTAIVYSLKTGQQVADFTTSDYMNILVEVLTEALKKFIIRLVWFNDTDAKHAPTGDFTAALDLDYFNMLNGFFVQMVKQVTANNKQLVVIKENAEAAYKDQILEAKAAYDYLTKVYFSAPLLLRGKQGAFMLVTQSVHDAYEQYLTGKELESTYKNIIDGIPTLTFKGIPVVPMPIWDRFIAEFQDTGSKLIDPHRIVYTTKDVLGVSVDAESSFSDIEIWYDRDTRLVKMEGMGKTDAKLMNPELFELAR